MGQHERHISGNSRLASPASSFSLMYNKAGLTWKPPCDPAQPLDRTNLVLSSYVETYSCMLAFLSLSIQI